MDTLGPPHFRRRKSINTPNARFTRTPPTACVSHGRQPETLPRWPATCGYPGLYGSGTNRIYTFFGMPLNHTIR